MRQPVQASNFCRIEFDTSEMRPMNRALGALGLAFNQGILRAARSLQKQREQQQKVSRANTLSRGSPLLGDDDDNYDNDDDNK